MAAAIPFVRAWWPDVSGKPLAGGKLWTYQAGTNTPVASYTDSTGSVPNTNPVILDSSGRASIYLAPGSYKIVLMDKNDVVQWTEDKVKPADGGGGGIVDSDYVFDGYSQLLNGQFGPSTGLMDTLARIIRITYTAPAISLSGSSNILREKGNSVSSITLSAAVTKRSNPIGTVRFYQGATLLSTQTTGPAIPSGGTNTHTYSTPFSDTISFSSQVDDTAVGSDGPTTVTSNTVTYTFLYAYYHGVGIASLSAAAVGGLTKVVNNPSASQSIAYSMSVGQKPYFAYPATFADLTSIKNASALETISSWTKRTEDITNAYGQTTSYKIYEFNNVAGVANDNTYTFIR